MLRAAAKEGSALGRFRISGLLGGSQLLWLRMSRQLYQNAS